MNKVLIIQTASIGDVILATALVESIHTAFPAAAIDFMVKKGNQSLFLGHPYLNRLIVWDKRSRKYRDLFAILNGVRKTNYDLVINLQRFFSTGLITAFSAAKETRGFSKNPLSFFFTKRVNHLIRAGVHEVIRNNVLIQDFAVAGSPHPRLYPTISDESMVAPLTEGVFYTISPASLWFTKQYPVEKWVELVRLIPSDATVYLTGASVDQTVCDQIIRQSGHPRAKNLAGKLTLLQSAALMQHARMNFTNDSAPMHLASAVNAPVTAIYCSTVPGFGFGPLSDNSTVVEIMEKLPCRPCGLHGFRTCPEKHFKCALNIRVEQLTPML